MNRFAGWAATLVVCWSISSAAEAQPPQRSAEFFQRLLERFDANDNGRLDPEERRAAYAARMKRDGTRPGTDRPGSDRPRNDRPGSDRPGSDRRPDARRPGHDAATAPLTGPAQQMLKRMTERFDADKDGKLDAAEVARARESMDRLQQAVANPRLANRPGVAGLMRVFDRDGDRRLNEGEQASLKEAIDRVLDYAAGQATGGAAMRRPGNRPSDTDKPGDRTPNRQLPEAVLRRFDENGNGRLDPNEMVKLREAAGRRRGGGGALSGGSLDESGAVRKPLLDDRAVVERFDADGDGELSAAERLKALEAAKK